MEDRKFCPLFAFRNPSSKEQSKCLESNCAWFDGYNNQCCILTVTHHLKNTKFLQQDKNYNEKD